MKNTLGAFENFTNDVVVVVGFVVVYVSGLDAMITLISSKRFE